MVARTASLQLKPTSVAEFTRTIETDIIPVLRQQPGFQDEMAFVVPGGTEAMRVSVWNHKAQVDASHHRTYPAVLRALANVVEGTPQVHIYEVSNSTVHKRVAHTAV
jgi:hypothetical protein